MIIKCDHDYEYDHDDCHDYQVGDVAWAPYSSTVFAAVTIDGKVGTHFILDTSYFIHKLAFK